MNRQLQTQPHHETTEAPEPPAIPALPRSEVRRRLQAGMACLSEAGAAAQVWLAPLSTHSNMAEA